MAERLKTKTMTAVALLCALILALTGCGDEVQEEEADEAARTQSVVARASEGDASDTWAFYWYLCGSDLESEYGAASDDLEEMMRADLPENVVVIIETGGAKEWHDDTNADANSRYLYSSQGRTLLEENPIANMGDASTLEDFLQFCNENYPADRQAVIFWNHGGGSVAGVAFDEHYDMDALTLPEMRSAFEAVGTASGEKYEIIGFDTCLMATIDVVDTVGDYGNYLVASQELEPGCGWDYQALFQAVGDDPGISTAKLGQVICDSYYAACEEEGTADMITLSVVDLAWSQQLVQAYNDIGTEALAGAGMHPSYLSAFGRAARSAENYGGNNNAQGYTNMVDLGDLVRQAGDQLLPNTGEALLEALKKGVIYQVKSPLRSGASGLSCYFNYDGDYEDYSGFADINTSPAFQYYFDYMLSGDISQELLDYMLTAAEPYTQEEFAPQAPVRPQADDLEDFPVAITDEGVATLHLGADIAQQLVGVYVSLAYIDQEQGLAIMLGTDNDIEADWENGVFGDNFRGVWGSLDGELVYMELAEEADEYQVYAVPVLLNAQEYTMLVSYIYSTETFDILGLRKGIDDNGMADKNIRPLIPGDVIEPLHTIIDLDTDEISQQAVDTIVVSENTRFYETDMGDGEFLLMFEMRDLRNESYLSQAVTIVVENGEIYLS